MTDQQGNRLVRGVSCSAAFFLVLVTTGPVAAQDVQIEVVLDGFRHPSSIAIQPETGTVFVSDSGNGRVARIVSGVAETVIAGYPVEPIGGDFGFQGGPLGIDFLSESKLAVGSGCWKPGMDRVSVFDVRKFPLTADDELFSRSLNSAGDTPAEGDFYGLVADADYVFVTCRGDDRQGWVGRLEVRPGKQPGQLAPGLFSRFAATRPETDTRWPTAITRSPDGYLVVGQRGDKGNPSTLAFFDQTSGDLRAKFDLNVSGLVALAYAPRTGRLFALCHSRHDASQNGLYKLVARRRNTRCEARRVAKIDQPAALAFSPDGDLWLTAGGENGKLLKIAGLDVVESKTP